MKKIIIIKDITNNGKCNILRFPTFFIKDIYIKNNYLFVKNINILQGIDIIIFDINEINSNWESNNNKNIFKTKENFNNYIIELEYIICKANITIYNKPSICLNILGNKLKAYDYLNKINNTNNIFNIPKYINSLDYINNDVNINYFPVICREVCDSHSINDFIYNKNNNLELKNIIKNINKNFLITELINSYNDKYNCYHSIRLMVFNNILIDYYYRPSNKQIIHTLDTNTSIFNDLDIEFNNFYINNYKLINNGLNDIYNLIGNGFYAYDCILYNNKLYICEIGLKFYDETFVNLINHNNITTDKISVEKTKLIEFYKNKL